MTEYEKIQKIVYLVAQDYGFEKDKDKRNEAVSMALDLCVGSADGLKDTGMEVVVTKKIQDWFKGQKKG